MTLVAKFKDFMLNPMDPITVGLWVLMMILLTIGLIVGLE